jgi:hypothetical protein
LPSPLLYVAVAAMAACASPSDPDTGDASKELTRNQQLFATVVGPSYEVTYENNCFCPIEVMQAVRLTVKNGAIADVTRVSDGAAVPSSEWRAYRTVDEVFAEINAGFNHGARRVDVEYDRHYGYPRQVLIDYQMAADAFVGFTLSDVDAIR